jgi:ABC-2 type transport system permease protein
MRFNPNVREEWYLGIIELINHMTMLSVVLTGAALLREREHGTLEHLLVMPLRPVEIALAKIVAMGAVILVAALLSLGAVVHVALGVPVRGSVPLWTASAALYLFSATAIGIFVATTVRSMPQFGLIMVPVIVPMIVLSGGFTPLDAQPDWLWWLMQLVPTTHFVDLSVGVLSRGAGLGVIWPHLAAIVATGGAFLAAALWRFRSSVARS